MTWETAQQVAKNDAGQFVALIGDKWEPVEQAAKNDAGQFMVMRASAPKKSLADHGKTLLGAVIAPADYAAHLASASMIAPASGLAGLVSEAMGKRGQGKEIQEDFQKKWLYQPQTEVGKGFAESPYNPLNALAKLLQAPGNAMPESPDGAATLQGMAKNFVTEAIPQAAGIAGIRYAPQISGVANAAIDKAGNIVNRAGGLVSRDIRQTNVINDMIRPQDRSAAASALRGAPEGLPGEQITAGQALAETNANKLSALLKLAEQRAPEKFGTGGPAPTGEIGRQNFNARAGALRGVAENMPAELRDLLASKPRQTADLPVVRSADDARQLLNTLTIPDKTTSLVNAQKWNNEVPPLRQMMNEEAGKAAQSTETVRRMNTAENLANDVHRAAAQGQLGNFEYRQSLGNRAAQVGEQAAADSLQSGQAARVAKGSIAGLEAQGFKPLTTDSLIQGIDRQLNAPGIRSSPDSVSVLNAVKEQLNKSSKNGTINSIDLDVIRQESINTIIDNLMKDANPSRKGKATRLSIDMKNAVKQAIEDAGGKGYIQHLDEYTTGRRNIGDMESAKTLGDAYTNVLDKESPQQFSTAVKNLERPPHSPELNRAISGVTDSLTRQSKYEANARAGTPEVSRMMGGEVLPPPIGVGPLNMKVTLARNLLNRFIGNATEGTLKDIAKIAHDPKKVTKFIEARDFDAATTQLLKTMFSENAIKGAAATVPSNKLSDLVREAP